MTEYGDAFNLAVAAELRAEKGRRQATIPQIIATTGLSKSAVLNYLNGKRAIPVPALLDICRAMGVDARVIFDNATKSLE